MPTSVFFSTHAVEGEERERKQKYNREEWGSFLLFFLPRQRKIKGGEKKLQRTLELCGNGGKCGYKERLVKKNGKENNFKINKKKKKKRGKEV